MQDVCICFVDHFSIFESSKVNVCLLISSSMELLSRSRYYSTFALPTDKNLGHLFQYKNHSINENNL